MQIRITKKFSFEMAHALLHHDGPCKNVHGHSYRLQVTLKGKPQKGRNPKAGMVMDFTDLKKIVNEAIVHPFDHALVLNEAAPRSMYAGLRDQKLILTAFQPTCENLLIHFVRLLGKKIKTGTLHHLRLEETGTSYAEWYADDNIKMP